MSWQIDAHGDVAVVTMNSNPVNAQGDAFFADLHDAFDRLDRDPPRTGVVLTAEGSTFSAGIDLKFALPLFASGDRRAVQDWFTRYRATNVRLFTYPRPTVAAINGHAFAGGVITALCCDYRIASDTAARFSLNEVPIGIPMPAVYVEIIRYAIGVRNAALTTLFGEVYDLSDAVELRFVDEVVPSDRLLDAAVARARLVPPESMSAYAFAKRALQAPAVDNIERLADPADALLAEHLTEPANVAAQQRKLADLAARSAGPDSSHVALARDLFARWADGDFAHNEWADPDVHFKFVDGPAAGAWTGRDEMRRVYGDYMSAWSGYRIEAEEILEVDAERVLVIGRINASGKVSGLKTDNMRAEAATVLRVVDGRATEVFVYFDVERALAEVGLRRR